MARKNLYVILNKSGLDFRMEFKRLLYLFREQKCVYEFLTPYTAKEFIDKEYFRQLSIRRSYTSVDDLESDLFQNVNEYNVTDENLYLYCEFLIALLPEDKVERYKDSCKGLFNQAVDIVNSISSILDRTNHEVLNIGSDDEPKLVIIESNKAATQAAQLVDNKTTAIELLEYNRFALKGDLPNKKKLLSDIGTYIEPILKSKQFQKSGYRQLESDAGFLLNNFHIRHNNKSGSKKKEFVVKMSDSDLENWYDSAYNTMLSVIIMNEQISISNKIELIKHNYNLG